MKETIQCTSKTYTVKTSHTNEKLEGNSNVVLKEINDLETSKGEQHSSLESLCSSLSRDKIDDDTGRNISQYANYDYPRSASIYENSGDESAALYVDGPNDFDPSLREYYIRSNSNSPKPTNLLQTQIQENSDNFQNYLRKYADGGGSTGSTESPLPQSTKSSNDNEEELGSSTWRRNSELIETQIRQDINEIDRTLELMSLGFDTPNQFLFDESEYDALNKKLNQISPPPDSKSNSKAAAAEPNTKRIVETTSPKVNSKASKTSPTYSNVFNLTPTINNSRLLSNWNDCRCTQR